MFVVGCDAGMSRPHTYTLSKAGYQVFIYREVQGLEERGWKGLGTKSSEISL